MNFKSYLIVFLICYSASIFGQGEKIYQLDWKKDGIIFGSSVLGLGLEQWISRDFVGLNQTEINLLNPSQINEFDRPAIYRYNLNSAKVSDYFRDGMLALPIGLMLSIQAREEWKEIGFLYLETIMVNTALTSVIKSIVRRNRPFTYNPAVSIDLKMEESAKRSFYSGHTSHVSALSFFTATVLNDLYPDSQMKWLWWTPAIILPGITAYLRYNAGKHFPSDLITGLGIGVLVGHIIPKIHRLEDTKLKLSMMPSSDGLSLLAIKSF